MFFPTAGSMFYRKVLIYTECNKQMNEDDLEDLPRPHGRQLLNLSDGFIILGAGFLIVVDFIMVSAIFDTSDKPQEDLGSAFVWLAAFAFLIITLIYTIISIIYELSTDSKKIRHTIFRIGGRRVNLLRLMNFLLIASLLYVSSILYILGNRPKVT